ncbi:endonuclease reverse transcriptase [Lasius niger]|uniref:Endonuclease reverse transcriptase n=2 Tax=Lasius TaxID=488720 RepID=A0A0J7JUT9_LASNI|nr:endonuclease reverse transcriptase [Lasius niger]
MFLAVLEIKCWPLIPANSTASEDAKRLDQILRDVCDLGASRLSKNLARRPVYWWNDTIHQLRKECIKCKRRYTRGRRRNDPEVDRTNKELVKTAKTKLKLEIKKAKEQAWQSLIEIIEHDP